MSSQYWNLLYIVASIAMMCFAYYSRHAQIQKLAAYVFAGWAASVLAFLAGAPLPIFMAVDIVGIGYAAKVWLIEPTDRSSPIVMWLFITMLTCHVLAGHGLAYQIALNVLYLAQLATLMAFGWIYGREARALE